MKPQEKELLYSGVWKNFSIENSSCARANSFFDTVESIGLAQLTSVEFHGPGFPQNSYL